MAMAQRYKCNNCLEAANYNVKDNKTSLDLNKTDYTDYGPRLVVKPAQTSFLVRIMVHKKFI